MYQENPSVKEKNTKGEFMNNYYVYIYWRLDTNEPFYIGKGHGDRWRQISIHHRNKHFININNKHQIMCEIIKDNLTEEEAFYWEEFIIALLVFEYGFSIDIRGCNSDDHYCHLVNQTWGGEGTSGMNPYDMVDEEKREEWKRKIGESSRRAWDNKELKKRISESRRGKNHHLYGKHHSDISKRKMSKAKEGMYEGKNNPRAKAIICITTQKIFFTTKDGANYYGIKQKTCISACCKGKQKSCGKLSDGTKLVWMYLEDFLNKCKYILLKY